MRRLLMGAALAGLAGLTTWSASARGGWEITNIEVVKISLEAEIQFSYRVHEGTSGLDADSPRSSDCMPSMDWLDALEGEHADQVSQLAGLTC